MKFFFNCAYLICCFITFFAFRSSGQVDDAHMASWQDSLLRLGADIYKQQDERVRLEKNFTFVKTLVSALKEKHSFGYNFGMLKMISILRAPDDRFRIFSWNVPLSDGSFLYYGAIQMKTASGELQLIPLLDKTFEIERPQEVLLTGDMWYGAQYYSIIPFGKGYILLGWKGHGPLVSQKVIEILQFDQGRAQLGAHVFADNPEAMRQIFNFSRQSQMFLQFDAPNKRIVLDHIVPSASNLQGNYQFYVPDTSHDAYELRGEKLFFQDDVQFRNAEVPDVEQKQQPARATPGKRSGF